MSSWLEQSVGGIRHHGSVDEGDGGLVITRMQNVQPILDYAAFLRSLGPAHYKGKKDENGEMWHYARIPLIELERMIREMGPEAVLGGKDTKRIISWIEREAPYLKVGDFKLA